MKKIINSRIFSFLLGAIIFGGISVVSAYTLFARDTSYTPEDETWEVNNVGAALDDLHNRIETIDDYVHKSYTQEGLGIYENRVNIVSGGYFVDEDNVVWVNLTLKFKY